MSRHLTSQRVIEARRERVASHEETRTFNGQARLVFEAWTRPELLKSWWVPTSMGMWFLMIFALLQQNIPGGLSGPHPAQMEKAPDLAYRPVPHGLEIPATIKMGAPSSVGITSDGHLIVFNRGPNALLEFDANGKFVRTIGQATYVRPHGFRIDPQGNGEAHHMALGPQGEIWVADTVKPELHKFVKK
jgi:hypothetical protein